MSPGPTARGATLPSWFGSHHDESRAARSACIAAVIGGAGATVFYTVGADRAGLLMRLVLVATALALAGYGLWQGFGRTAPRLAPSMTLIGWLASAQIGLAVAALGADLHSIVLAFQALMVMLVTITGSARGRLGGGALAAACGIGVLLLGWHEAVQPGPADGSVSWAVLAHLALLAVAVGLGVVIRRVLSHQMATVAEREARFHDLLACAADWYWELDADLRFTQLDERLNKASGIPGSERLGRHPWELALGLTPAQLDAHRADLQAHRPFRDLAAQRRGPNGERRHVTVSGEPRFGPPPEREFLGYRGVGRDVTATVEAQRTVVAVETRYHELFTCSPMPLVMERDGELIEANATALSLFGYPDLDAMRRTSLIDHFDAAEGSRQRAREWSVRLDRLEPGQRLPAEEFQLNSADAQRYLVRAIGVRVNAAGGPANLTIFSDETERRAAGLAMQRSESLLAHLVATSPDAIAMVESGSDRYTMVNQTFSKVFGFSNAEVLGHTSTDIRLWPHPAEREKLLQRLAQAGSVEALPVTLRARNGTLLSMLVSASSFEFDGTAYIVFNARDVSRLESTRGVYEAILQNASVGIGFTRQHEIVQANARLSEMFGWPDGTLVGRSIREVWPDDADYEAHVAATQPQLMAGERVEFERLLRRQDGSEICCRVQGRMITTAHPELGGTIWIIEDVTEQRSVSQALTEAYAAAETASRAKSAFLANTSHELRTPLNALLGLARLAQDDGLDAPRRRRYIDQMADSAQNLADIINDVLDLSKIEAGKLEIETVPFDLHDKLSALQRAFAALAEARKLELSLDIHADVPRHVHGDPVRVRQIISNFVSNALKFTTRGGVSIRVRNLDKAIRFDVIDSGPGIGPEVCARLFTPFTQADESTTRRFGGTGLGLSICRELAGLMGGAVGVDSEVGRGSVFWCELPLPRDDHEALVTQYSTFHGHDPLYGSNILVVEDNPVNMMICVALLEQHGVRVTQADNGLSAIEAVEASRQASAPFDAVLMDMQMPVMGGQEATRLLRQTYTARELPIIALTAAALVSEREQAIEAGMNAFLTKPIEPRRLVRALSRVLVGDGVASRT